MSLESSKSPRDTPIGFGMVLSRVWAYHVYLFRLDRTIPEYFQKEILERSFKREAQKNDVALDERSVRLDHRTVLADGTLSFVAPLFSKE